MNYLKKWNDWCKNAESQIEGFSNEDFARTLMWIIKVPMMLLAAILPFSLEVMTGDQFPIHPGFFSVFGVLLIIMVARSLIASTVLNNKEQRNG